jgi:hypothetical protein
VKVGLTIALRGTLPRNTRSNGGIERTGGINVAILETQLCQAHRDNINRYERLLKTYLTEIERDFIELRLSEEHAALRLLDPKPRYEVMASSRRND